MNERKHIVIVRLGAMGDIIHALPALSTLRASYPDAKITWITAPKWMPLLDGNPQLDCVLPFHRTGPAEVFQSWRIFRELQPDVAFDFQGLIQSALVARSSRPGTLYGFDRSVLREELAAVFYSRHVCPVTRHVVDRNIELVKAAGAQRIETTAWLPQGSTEGALPTGPFVLCNPFAGWISKQWPMHRYVELATLLHRQGMPLVANVPEARVSELPDVPGLHIHTSSLAGLIDATRRASAVLGLDSGPLHLAAALSKPGVALFGPTDPVRNGPYRSAIRVIRVAGAVSTYRREKTIHPSMSAISAEQVAEALEMALPTNKQEEACL